MRSEEIIEVFIGSPGDVKEERRHAIETIEQLNKDPLLPDGWRFEAIAWDTGHYTKDARLSPQEAINRGLTAPEKCQICIFIFWKRTGTQLAPNTFNENTAGKYPTGSLWEYHNAIESPSRPLTLVYHNQRDPVYEKQHDGTVSEFAQQLESVETLFNSFQDDQQRYIADKFNYNGIEQFTAQLKKDLGKHLKKLTTNQNTSSEPQRVIQGVPKRYLAKLKTRVSKFELLGLDIEESVHDGLPQVYVPATVHAQKPKDNGEKETADFELLLNAIGERSLYLSGDAGTGKSTFSQWVCYAIANGSVPEHRIKAEDELSETLPADLLYRLPVLLRLRDFWPKMDCDSTQCDWKRSDLEKSLTKWVEYNHSEALSADCFIQNLSEGNLLLILDGIDEVPEAFEGRAPKKALLTGLSNALEHWIDLGNRILLTSRPYGLTSAEQRQLSLPEVSLLPLNETLQQLFIQRWYAVTDKDAWQERSRGLLAELQGRDELEELRSNPLLLTALCVKYKEGKRLPKDIYELFNSIVNQILHNRYRYDKNDRERVRWRLEAVALGMQYGIDDKQPHANPLASISLDKLQKILLNYADIYPTNESGAAEIQIRRDELLEKSGLMVSRNEQQAEFFHQYFRDFLAAEHWLKNRSFEEALEQFGTNRHWRKMLGFLFAKSLKASGSLDSVLNDLEVLQPHLTEQALQKDASTALLLADCYSIAFIEDNIDQVDSKWAKTLRAICHKSLKVVRLAKDRHELFLQLGALHWDTRPGIGINAQGLPDIHWQAVAGADNTSFYISTYLVTYKQFQCFISAGDGYQNPQWWQGFEAQMTTPASPRWQEANMPRINVSWFEAIAFCRWLDSHIEKPHANWQITLPTEHEWRQAYVLEKDTEYPWAGPPDPNKHANYEFDIGRTSAVGLYPRGIAMSGALDMAGNVWEWCLSKYEKDTSKRDQIDVSNDVRVLRGGSWIFNDYDLRSSDRNWYDPDSRLISVGFRIVCRPIGH